MSPRLLSLGATVALALGLVAAPAAAAGITVYIDDDGKAGAAGCNGSTVVPSSIQSAVDASGPGDTILVCPGTYPEQVDIAGAAHKGLTIRATSRYAAKVRPANAGFLPIIRVASPRVTIQRLRVVAPTVQSCSQATSGILVDGVANARILSNLVLANPSGDTLDGSAGLYEGITIDDGSTGALVQNNIVRAFQMVGIMVHNADAKVINNSVQYWHATPSQSNVACRKAPKRTSPAIPSSTTGIRSYQSSGVINLNAITNAPEGQQSFLYVSDGISVQGSDRLRIRRNLVTGAYSAMLINDSDSLRIADNVLVGPVPPQQSGAASPALLAVNGLVIANGTGSVIRDNRVAHFSNGITMEFGASGNSIDGNDATGNATDCQEVTSIPAGVTSNEWGLTTPNLGNFDQPTGLCTDAPISPIPGSPT
jgi:nitrous oxidase accessory protein NosD